MNIPFLYQAAEVIPDGAVEEMTTEKAFWFAVDAVTPIILLVMIGYLLKRIGILKAEFAKLLNKIVFRVFLPVTLFLNVYNITDFSATDLRYIVYALLMILALFAIAIPVTLLCTKHGDRRGPMVQVAFRSNYALVGLPLAFALFGAEGETLATLLSAVSIPLFNILAVISLSVFRREEGKRAGVKGILLGIAKNPLIIGIALGAVMLGIRALFEQWGVSYRLTQIGPLFETLDYLSGVSTPLALIALGAQFEFSAIKEMRREIIVGTLSRVVLAPLLGVGIAYLFFRNQFGGAHFATFVALFATPVAVSSLPMAQEMGNNATLAGQYVVWTTILSAITIFLCSFLLSMAGVF